MRLNQPANRSQRRQACWFFFAASCALLAAVFCQAQAAPGGNAGERAMLQAPGGIGVAGPSPDIGTFEPNEKQVKALNVMRQKSMVSDTDKLLRLVKELNDEIAANSPAALTAEQLRKLATIEKLAHSVKEKMSTPVLGAQPPVFGPIRPIP
jgi:hypothetical protein